ncbi:MAG: FtsX-like permease family protein [Chloroflexi bacterium]|nr:FtsX-like permease family protein [Chloroflexota bacterium]
MVKVPRIILKSLRDLWKGKIQYGAVSLIIFIGILIFVCCYEAYLNLNMSYNAFYDRLNMADYWVSVDGVSRNAVKDMNEIAGVDAYGRIVEDLFIDMGGESGEKVVGRVITLPENEMPGVNRVEIEVGNYFSGSSGREILVERHFATYYNLKPGDWLTLEYEQVKMRFRIRGIVMSPEHIWIVKSAQEPMPTPRTFGVIFMPLKNAEKIFNMEGMINEVTISVAPDKDRDRILDQVKTILERNYIKRMTSKDDPVVLQNRRIDIVQGIRTAYMTARKDLPVVQLLRQDMESFAMLAFLFPMLFLAMASLTIYVLLNRLVESQRIQIGLMRAMGYGQNVIMLHYLGFAIVVGVVGSITGVIAGHLLANGLTEMYVQQLNIPIIETEVHWGTILAGIITGLSIPLIAGLVPAWSTIRIQPAEAMRPATPGGGNRFVMKVLTYMLRPFPYYIKMPIRNVLRNFRRSLFMASGIASAIIMVLVAMSFVDAVDESFARQWDTVQKYDALIHLQGESAASNVSLISHLEGIAGAEAVLDIPYRIRFKDKKIDTSIEGIQENSSMLNLITQDGTKIDVSAESILLPYSYKDKLGAQIGDILRLEPLTGTVGETDKRLGGYVWSYVGGRAYMPLREVQKLQRDFGAATGIMVRFDGQPDSYTLKRIYNIPQVASMEIVTDTRKMIDEQMGFFWVMIGIMLLMGTALGAAIIFNGVMVNITQRTREMAVMRAVGLGDRMLAFMISLENILIAAIGVAAGIPLGKYISRMFFEAMSTSAEDVISMAPPEVSMRSYIIACTAAVLIMLISQIPAILQIVNQNLATVTKEWSE